MTGAGVVTFLFTDLVGSTRTLDRLGEEGAEALRRAHFALLRRAVAESAGEEVKSLGDGLMVAFASPVDAIAAAVRIQSAVAGQNGERPDRALAVRVGVHAGEPAREGGDYFGTPVVVAKRLCDAACGGQILAGELVAALVGSRGGFTFRGVGRLDLKGLSRPLPTVEVVWESEATVSATPRADRPVALTSRRAASRGPDLVGRCDELALLAEEFAQAASGQFHFVLLLGEPGVGKTRLATELALRQEKAATVLHARAHPMAASAAFGLWAEAVEPYLELLGAEEVADLCGGFLDDLAGLFHAVAAVRGAPSAAEAPRPRLLAGLTRLVGGLAQRAPLIVVLDDIHWADASSWEVLRHLARRLDDSPLLVIATARPAELAALEVASQALFELDQDGLLCRVDLGGLRDADLRDLAAALTGAAPPPALVPWLAERSRGNALYAIGLLRALLEEGADLAAPTLRRLPEALADRVLARFRSYRGTGRDLIELLAVSARPVALGELCSWSGRQPDDVGAALTEIIASRAVAERERGRELTYELSHPLVRDALYEGIGGARRRTLHRQVGRALREAGRIAEAAVHLARSAEPGDAEAVEVLLAALREAEDRQAMREALALLGELTELLGPADPRWLDVLGAMHGRAEWVVDHRADVHARVAVTALRAMDGLLAASLDIHGRAVVKFRLAHVLAWGMGESAAAEELCEAARSLYESACDPEQALLAQAELAWLRGLRGDFPAMEDLAEDAVAVAEAAGQRYAALQALSALAYARMARGRFSACAEASSRAAEIARADEKSYRLGMVLTANATRLLFEGHTRQAREVLDEAKQLNAAYRDSVLVEVEAGMWWAAADYPAAVAAARDAAVWDPGGSSRRRCFGACYGAMAAAELGDVAEAERMVARAEAALRGRDFLLYLPAVRHAAGIVARHQGRLADAIELMRSAWVLLDAMEGYAWAALLLPDYAECAAEAGDDRATADAVAGLARVAESVDRPLHHGLAALGRAHVFLAGKTPESAAEAARTAITHLGETGFRGHSARAYDVLGRALKDADRAGAVAALEEAVRLFGLCGARWRRERSVEAMRRMGSSGRRAVAAAMGPESLTRRERDVARLAVTGMSARDIAQTLFVGERTVETHLGHVYAKLGVESKLDLVRRAAELGLL